MPILLYCVGAVAFAMGAAAIGYGIPINEFSFGNTLIIAGAVLLAGGLVVLALGVVVSRVQQLAEALARPTSMRLGRVEAEMQPTLRAAAQPGVARVPFPPKPKAPPPRPEVATEPAPPAPEPEESKPEAAAAPPLSPVPRSFALPPLPKRPLREPEEVAPLPSPLLPNPELGEASEPEDTHDRPVAEAGSEAKPEPETEPSLDFKPFRPESRAAEEDEAEQAALEQEGPPLGEPHEREPRRPEPIGLEPFRPAAPAPAKAEAGSFDAMWPASPKPDVSAGAPTEAIPTQPDAEEADRSEPSQDEPRTVAILKSGVVDGMGYTLYVDGSIEAELPQGTLRFASINELRAHLEKSN